MSVFDRSRWPVCVRRRFATGRSLDCGFVCRDAYHAVIVDETPSDHINETHTSYLYAYSIQIIKDKFDIHMSVHRNIITN